MTDERINPLMKQAVKIDQLGTAGIWLTILLSPCCFPLAAVLASFAGLSTTFEIFGSWTFYVLQGMVILAVLGLFIAYPRHRNRWPLLIAIPSAALIFYGYHFINSETWTIYIYAGMSGMLTATLLNHYRMKTNQKIQLLSTITCPECGHKSQQRMPKDSCQYFYDCPGCKSVLRPKQGDCCVFCSYGTVKCPPVQLGNTCCG